MSESPSGPEQPPADQTSKSATPPPQKKKRDFLTIIRGVFPPREPKIIPDDLETTTKAEPAARPKDETATPPPPGAISALPAGGPAATGNRLSSFLRAQFQALADALPILIVLLLVAFLLWQVARWIFPPAKDLLTQPAPPPPVEAAISPPDSTNHTGYSDDLHAFTVSFADGEPWVAMSTALDCPGSVFALDATGLQTQDPKYPRLRVCFIDFALNHPGKPLTEYLEERRAKPMGLQVFQLDPGMIREAEIGTAKTPGRGAYLLGTEGESSRPTKWYIAVVNFEGRIYAVEAVATQAEWTTYWPRFEHLMARIEFETGVIRPVPTAITLD